MLTMPPETEARHPAEPPAAVTYDKLGEWLLFMQIINSTFLQKAAITVGGVQLYLAFFVSLGLCVFGFVTKRLEFSASRLPLYLCMLGGLSLTQLFGTYAPSILSFIFLLSAHIPYMFCLKNGMSRPGIELEFFQKVCIIISCLGILQFFSQYAIGDYAYFIDSMLPKSFVVQGFNGMNPVSGGSIYKSNGVFMLEPALFCQLLAIAILIEIVYFKRPKVLALFVIAVGVSFSGTGLIILFLLTPFYLIQKKRYDILMFMAVMAISAPAWAPIVGLDNTLNRIGEFANPHSSGYARFISMFPFINTYILPEVDTFLFGRGAGGIPYSTDPTNRVDYAIFDPTWAKVFFEYGSIGFTVYFGFMAFVFIRPPRSAYLKWALFIQYIILGEYLVPPTVHCFIIALLAWPSMNAMKEFHEKLKLNETSKKKAPDDDEVPQT